MSEPDFRATDRQTDAAIRRTHGTYRIYKISKTDLLSPPARRPLVLSVSPSVTDRQATALHSPTLFLTHRQVQVQYFAQQKFVSFL